MFNCQRKSLTAGHILRASMEESVNTSWRETVDIDLYIYDLKNLKLLNQGLPN